MSQPKLKAPYLYSVQLQISGNRNNTINFNMRFQHIPGPPIGNKKLLEERLRRYEKEADQITIIDIEDSMNVDPCFVLDCTGSMSEHITAHIICGYSEIKSYDESDDVLGGLNATIISLLPCMTNIQRAIQKINDSTEVMLKVFREIIGEFPVFDLKTTKLEKYIFFTTKKASYEPNWIHLPEKTEELLCQNINFKLAPQPFSVGAERYLISLLIQILNKQINYFAYFLSTEFNKAAKEVGVNKKYADFKRFNVNNGLITEFHSIFEEFAHLTYEYTEGYLLVYDLQGVDLDN
ncbi:12518_t:CDS:2, partial [Dentiscutata heterogama]